MNVIKLVLLVIVYSQTVLASIEIRDLVIRTEKRSYKNISIPVSEENLNCNFDGDLYGNRTLGFLKWDYSKFTTLIFSSTSLSYDSWTQYLPDYIGCNFLPSVLEEARKNDGHINRDVEILSEEIITPRGNFGFCDPKYPNSESCECIYVLQERVSVAVGANAIYYGGIRKVLEIIRGEMCLSLIKI